MYVYFSVDERSLQRYMKERQPALDLRVRAFGCASRKYRSGSRWIPIRDSRTKESSTLRTTRLITETGTIQLRGVAENKQGLFVSGSRVRVRVPVSEPYSAVLVPDTAILSDQDKRYVLWSTTRTWCRGAT